MTSGSARRWCRTPVGGLSEPPWLGWRLSDPAAATLPHWPHWPHWITRRETVVLVRKSALGVAVAVLAASVGVAPIVVADEQAALTEDATDTLESEVDDVLERLDDIDASGDVDDVVVSDQAVAATISDAAGGEEMLAEVTADQVAIDAGDVSVSMSLPTQESSEVTVAGQAVVAQSTDESFDTIAQITDDGVRAVVNITGSDAPDSYEFELDVPEGAVLVLADDGGIDIALDTDGVTAVVGRVEAPWAVDADGNEIVTSYRLDGNVLTQYVDHVGATYPVMADPRISIGWGVYVTYSRTEVNLIARLPTDKAKYAAIACGALAKMAYLALACSYFIYDSYSSISRTFRNGRINRCHVEMRYVGATVVGWRTKNCLGR